MKTDSFVIILVLLCIIGFNISIESPGADIREQLGLVALWTFDQGTANEKSVDDVFGDNDGTVVGKPKIIKGFLGNAMDFDGVVDCVKMINDIFSPSVSMEAIIKPVAGLRNPIYDKYNYGIQTVDSNQVGVWIRAETADTNKQWISAYTAFPYDGQWHHVVGVAEDKKNVRIYLDGKLKTTNPALDPISIAYGSTVKPSIAYTQHLNGIWYKGGIDEVAVYNRALSDTDVAKLYVKAFSVEHTGKIAISWSKIKKQ